MSYSVKNQSPVVNNAFSRAKAEAVASGAHFEKTPIAQVKPGGGSVFSRFNNAVRSFFVWARSPAQADVVNHKTVQESWPQQKEIWIAQNEERFATAGLREEYHKIVDSFDEIIALPVEGHRTIFSQKAGGQMALRRAAEGTLHGVEREEQHAQTIALMTAIQSLRFERSAVPNLSLQRESVYREIESLQGCWGKALWNQTRFKEVVDFIRKNNAGGDLTRLNELSSWAETRQRSRQEKASRVPIAIPVSAATPRGGTVPIVEARLVD